MADSGALEILLLGPLEVRRDGEPLRLGGAKPKMLVADLALHLGEVVSVDRLIDDLWGEHPPRSAGHAVEVYVSQLRRQLAPALARRPPGYALHLDADRLDTVRFSAQAAEGAALVEHDPASAAATLAARWRSGEGRRWRTSRSSRSRRRTSRGWRSSGRNAWRAGSRPILPPVATPSS